MSDRTPNEAYLKSRRALVVTSGLLALSLLSGITPSDTDGSLTFFSLRLKSPENIPHIFLIITIYLVWQLWSAWLVQADSVRRSTINKIDVFLSFLISICAIGIWCWPYLLRIGAAISGEHAGAARWSAAIGGLIAAILSYALLKASTATRREMAIKSLIKHISTKSGLADGIGSDDLVDKEWILIFNPIHGRSKRITFLVNGEIGAGKNQNESYWRIVNGRLEILNSQKKVFSRFAFDNVQGRFNHTDEEDTLSIRGQVIVPAPA